MPNALVVDRDTGTFLVCSDGSFMATCECCLDAQSRDLSPANGFEWETSNPFTTFSCSGEVRYCDTVELWRRPNPPDGFPWTLWRTDTSPTYGPAWTPVSFSFPFGFAPPESIQWRWRLTNTCGASEVFTDARTWTVYLASSCSGCSPALSHEYDLFISGLVDFGGPGYGSPNYSAYNGAWTLPWIDNYSPADPHCWWVRQITNVESGWNGPAGASYALLTLRQFAGNKYQINLLYPDGWNSRWNTAAGAACSQITTAYSLVQYPAANGSEIVTATAWAP